MIYNYWFVIWGVCSSYLTVLSRYKEQILTCYLVCCFSHLSLVMMYHGCHMFVLGMLLHLETSTLFEFCHKLVRRAHYQKKKERETRFYTSHKSQNRYITARAQDCCKHAPQMPLSLCRQRSFCKEKHERNLWSHQKLQFGCSKDCVTSNWYRKANKKLRSISGVVILQSKETKTANKQKTLNSKYFLQHQPARGLQRRHTSTTTKTWVACGNSPDMRVNTGYINSTRGTSSNVRLQGSTCQSWTGKSKKTENSKKTTTTKFPSTFDLSVFDCTTTTATTLTITINLQQSSSSEKSSHWLTPSQRW